MPRIISAALTNAGARDMLPSMKGQQKPKQLAKKAPQKTLKERRAGKKAAAKDKRSSSGF
jgi:hypothetical protein